MGKSNYPIQIAGQQLTKDRMNLSFVSGEQMCLNFLIVDKTAALSYQCRDHVKLKIFEVPV